MSAKRRKSYSREKIVRKLRDVDAMLKLGAEDQCEKAQWVW